MTLAEVLRSRRRERFMSQKDLAAQLDVTWGTVQRWEAGKSLPFPAQQRRLLTVLELKPEELRAALDASARAREGKVAA